MSGEIDKEDGNNDEDEEFNPNLLVAMERN